MGVGRRFLDLARANLNALLTRAARTELDGASDEDLTAELQRRRSERSAQELERQRRIAMEAAAQSRGKSRPAAQAPQAGKQGRGRAPSSPRPSTEAHYRTLGLVPGATFEEVKRAYRALMREHHPDRHAGDAQQQKAASDRAARITTAYAALQEALRPARGR